MFTCRLPTSMPRFNNNSPTTLTHMQKVLSGSTLGVLLLFAKHRRQSTPLASPAEHWLFASAAEAVAGLPALQLMKRTRFPSLT